MKRLLFAALCATAGCGLVAEDNKLEDDGELCVDLPGNQQPFMPQAARTFPADQAFEITVANPGCLSSSCDTEREATCTVTRSGNVIEVKSTLAWTHKGNTCTADCRVLVATCSTDPLPAGIYTVKHGDQSATITVGGDNPPCPDLAQ